MKPSILRDISEELQLQPQPQLSNFADDSDKLILEDELQRIRLFGKIDVHKVVTGIVVAVLGMYIFLYSKKSRIKYISSNFLYNFICAEKNMNLRNK